MVRKSSHKRIHLSEPPTLRCGLPAKSDLTKITKKMLSDVTIANHPSSQ